MAVPRSDAALKQKQHFFGSALGVRLWDRLSARQVDYDKTISQTLP
jgi:hypothetical protein